MIYFRDSYILIMFFLLPYDQSRVSSHSCLDTHSLSVDKLPKDEKFSFVRILELYLQGYNILGIVLAKRRRDSSKCQDHMVSS